jgi:hypothetical protein
VGCQSCLDGYNVCIFAYGQTGSGKTFTMTGSADMPGLTPRAITELYDGMAKNKACDSKVSAYFVELYNDQVCGHLRLITFVVAEEITDATFDRLFYRLLHVSGGRLDLEARQQERCTHV